MTLSSPKKAKPSSVRWRIRFRFLILAAAILHLGVTDAVFAVGRFGLMPSQFDHNGLAAFASDGYVYQTEILELCDVLKTQGMVAWATWPTQLHLRLYSLPLAALGSSSGFSILKIEPLNLIYYLAILGLLFKLGATVFNYRTGLIAAGTVAIWPSFVLHTTQLLRDPLLITAFLILMVAVVLCLKRDYPWIRGLLGGVAAATAIVLIRIVRLPMWSMLWATTAMAVLFLIIRLLRQHRYPIGNIIFALMMIAALLIAPHFQTAFHNQQVVRRPRVIVPEEVQKLPLEEQIAARRQGFALRLDNSGQPVPSEAGSDIDRGVRFNGTADIIWHLPRALVVGVFAPFPNMWIGAGKQVGGSGRMLSGFETLLSYMIECLALFGLWQARRDISGWFVFLVITLGAVALGLVVANIGALYRLRYPFWALLIVFGAGGVDYLFRRSALAANAGDDLVLEKSAGTLHN
jgi:putative peptidoglycan lipid II flippase